MNIFLSLNNKSWITESKYILLLGLLLGCFNIGVAQPVNWTSLEKAQKQASQNNKKVMVFAEADWCQYCKRMHKEVFPKKSVQDSLSKYFYPVKLDVDSKQKIRFNGQEFTQRSLSRKFRVSGTPTTIFLDSKGKILGTQPGFLRPEIFDKLLAYVGGERFNSLSFKEYLHKHGIQF